MRLFSILLGMLFTANTTASVLLDAPLNEYQWFGSHNSYKRALPAILYNELAQLDRHAANQINYAHPSLQRQLDTGLRQLEIDVVNDPLGHQYQYAEMESRLHQVWLTEEERHTLAQPGFKVLHIPHVDVLSHCVTFQACLKQLVSWSDNHPNHFPIVVMINAKENQPSFITKPPPVAFTSDTYSALDDLIKKVMGHRLVSPDDIRGSHTTLRDAVVTGGWPSADSLKGKWLFLFDGNDSQRALYRKNHASLHGRSMFASYEPNSDEAAIFIRNNPIELSADITKLVRQGFMVRTRADANLSASPQAKAKQREAAINSGAQIISTDFYAQSPQAKKYGYQAEFADGTSLRRRHSNPLL
jgi:hypothetical protein